MFQRKTKIICLPVICQPVSMLHWLDYWGSLCSKDGRQHGLTYVTWSQEIWVLSLTVGSSHLTSWCPSFPPVQWIKLGCSWGCVPMEAPQHRLHLSFLAPTQYSLHRMPNQTPTEVSRNMLLDCSGSWIQVPSSSLHKIWVTPAEVSGNYCKGRSRPRVCLLTFWHHHQPSQLGS